MCQHALLETGSTSGTGRKCRELSELVTILISVADLVDPIDKQQGSRQSGNSKFSLLQLIENLIYQLPQRSKKTK